MTKCVQRIRDLFEYALYKFTLYLLTYLHESSNIWRWDSTPIENLKLKTKKDIRDTNPRAKFG